MSVELIARVAELETEVRRLQEKSSERLTATGDRRAVAGGKRTANRNAHVGVAILVRRESDRALLMGLRCGAHGTGTWSVPGGHLEFQDVGIVEGGLRELREEAGLDVSVTHAKLTPHATYTHFYENNRAYVTLYVAVTVQAYAEAKILEPDRCAEWRWILPGAPAPGPLFRPFENLINLGVNPWTV